MGLFFWRILLYFWFEFVKALNKGDMPQNSAALDAFAECPELAALPDVDVTACQETITRIFRVFFIRWSPVTQFDTPTNDIRLLATMQAYTTAVDSTKMVPSFIMNNVPIGSSEVVEAGGGADSVDNKSYITGESGPTVEGTYLQTPLNYRQEMGPLEQESKNPNQTQGNYKIGGIFVSANGDLWHKVDGSGNPLVIPMTQIVTLSRNVNSGQNLDGNPFRFNLPADWDKDLGKTPRAELEYDPLSLTAFD